MSRMLTRFGRPQTVSLGGMGTGSLFAFCAYDLYGFQAIPHAIEERLARIELRTISKILVISIGAAATSFIVSSLLAQAWRCHGGRRCRHRFRRLLQPAAAPYGRVLTVALLCATAVSLLKAWNGIFMMAVRLLVAMARAGLFPRQSCKGRSAFPYPVQRDIGNRHTQHSRNISGPRRRRAHHGYVLDGFDSNLRHVLRHGSHVTAPLASLGSRGSQGRHYVGMGRHGGCQLPWRSSRLFRRFGAVRTGLPLEFRLLMTWLFFWVWWIKSKCCNAD